MSFQISLLQNLDAQYWRTNPCQERITIDAKDRDPPDQWYLIGSSYVDILLEFARKWNWPESYLMKYTTFFSHFKFTPKLTHEERELIYPQIQPPPAMAWLPTIPTRYQHQLAVYFRFLPAQVMPHITEALLCYKGSSRDCHNAKLYVWDKLPDVLKLYEQDYMNFDPLLTLPCLTLIFPSQTIKNPHYKPYGRQKYTDKGIVPPRVFYFTRSPKSIQRRYRQKMRQHKYTLDFDQRCLTPLSVQGPRPTKRPLRLPPIPENRRAPRVGDTMAPLVPLPGPPKLPPRMTRKRKKIISIRTALAKFLSKYQHVEKVPKCLRPETYNTYNEPPPSVRQVLIRKLHNLQQRKILHILPPKKTDKFLDTQPANYRHQSKYIQQRPPLRFLQPKQIVCQTISTNGITVFIVDFECVDITNPHLLFSLHISATLPFFEHTPMSARNDVNDIERYESIGLVKIFVRDVSNEETKRWTELGHHLYTQYFVNMVFKPHYSKPLVFFKSLYHHPHPQLSHLNLDGFSCEFVQPFARESMPKDWPFMLLGKLPVMRLTERTKVLDYSDIIRRPIIGVQSLQTHHQQIEKLAKGKWFNKRVFSPFCTSSLELLTGEEWLTMNGKHPSAQTQPVTLITHRAAKKREQPLPAVYSSDYELQRDLQIFEHQNYSSPPPPELYTAAQQPTFNPPPKHKNTPFNKRFHPTATATAVPLPSLQTSHPPKTNPGGLATIYEEDEEEDGTKNIKKTTKKKKEKKEKKKKKKSIFNKVKQTNSTPQQPLPSPSSSPKIKYEDSYTVMRREGGKQWVELAERVKHGKKHVASAPTQINDLYREACFNFLQELPDKLIMPDNLVPVTKFEEGIEWLKQQRIEKRLRDKDRIQARLHREEKMITIAMENRHENDEGQRIVEEMRQKLELEHQKKENVEEEEQLQYEQQISELKQQRRQLLQQRILHDDKFSLVHIKAWARKRQQQEEMKDWLYLRQEKEKLLYKLNSQLQQQLEQQKRILLQRGQDGTPLPPITTAMMMYAAQALCTLVSLPSKTPIPLCDDHRYNSLTQKQQRRIDDARILATKKDIQRQIYLRSFHERKQQQNRRREFKTNYRRFKRGLKVARLLKKYGSKIAFNLYLKCRLLRTPDFIVRHHARFVLKQKLLSKKRRLARNKNKNNGIIIDSNCSSQNKKSHAIKLNIVVNPDNTIQSQPCRVKGSSSPLSSLINNQVHMLTKKSETTKSLKSTTASSQTRSTSLCTIPENSPITPHPQSKKINLQHIVKKVDPPLNIQPSTTTDLTKLDSSPPVQQTKRLRAVIIRKVKAPVGQQRLADGRNQYPLQQQKQQQSLQQPQQPQQPLQQPSPPHQQKQQQQLLQQPQKQQQQPLQQQQKQEPLQQPQQQKQQQSIQQQKQQQPQQSIQQHQKQQQSIQQQKQQQQAKHIVSMKEHRALARQPDIPKLLSPIPESSTINDSCDVNCKKKVCLVEENNIIKLFHEAPHEYSTPNNLQEQLQTSDLTQDVTKPHPKPILKPHTTPIPTIIPKPIVKQKHRPTPTIHILSSHIINPPFTPTSTKVISNTTKSINNSSKGPITKHKYSVPKDTTTTTSTATTTATTTTTTANTGAHKVMNYTQKQPSQSQKLKPKKPPKPPKPPKPRKITLPIPPDLTKPANYYADLPHHQLTLHADLERNINFKFRLTRFLNDPTYLERNYSFQDWDPLTHIELCVPYRFAPKIKPINCCVLKISINRISGHVRFFGTTKLGHMNHVDQGRNYNSITVRIKTKYNGLAAAHPILHQLLSNDLE